MAAGNGKFTRTEQRMFDVLNDGEAHALIELMNCMNDADGAEVGTAKVHIHNMNNKLKMLLPGHTIIAIRNPGRRKEVNSLYRLVRVITKGE